MIRLAALALTLLPAAALAQEVDVDCANAQTTMEMAYCAEQDWIAADADLNEAYKAAREVMRAIDADLPKDKRGGEQYLRDGQRAWVTFRDATCNAEGYTMYGGSAESLVIYGCWGRLTEQRATDLWAMTEPY